MCVSQDLPVLSSLSGPHPHFSSSKAGLWRARRDPAPLPRASATGFTDQNPGSVAGII